MQLKPDNPFVRADGLCPHCGEAKTQGLLLCWPCHHKQKEHYDGDYGKLAKRQIAAREAFLEKR